jgi:long-subunit acyl-CoA synthetase (AMP-forming)
MNKGVFHMSKMKYQTILQMIENQYEGSVALSYDDNGEILDLTYKHVKNRVLAYPVNKDKKCVGIICDGKLDKLIAMMAYINQKITVVLISLIDNISLIQEEISTVGVDLLIGPEDYKNNFRMPPDSSNPPQGKIIFFTSGTTSKAKPVILTEEKLCAAAYNGSCCLSLKPQDKLLSCLPLSHVFGFICSWLWAWQNGASIILSRGIYKFFDDFEYFKPTAVSLVPQMASILALKELFNPELKLVLIGAGDCPSPVLTAISCMGIRVSFGYGLTETSSGVALSLGDHPRAFTVCPLDDVKIADDYEMLVKSDETIFEGYYPDNTGYKDLFTEDGYFKTGDLGAFDDSNLLNLKGRKKDTLVLLDGTKVFLPEVEEDLMGRLGVTELALGTDKDGNVVLCLGKVYKSELDDFEADIDDYNSNQPRSKRISKVICIPEGLPKNNTGKVKRYEINFNE